MNVPDVLPLAFDAVENDVLRLLAGAHAAPPRRMKVGCFRRHGFQRVIDLIEEPADVFRTLILDGDLGALAERHRPIGVEAARGIHVDHQRIHVVAKRVRVREEIAQRTLDGRRRFPVPIEAQNAVAIRLLGDRDPDVLDDARPLNVGEGHSLPPLQIDERPDLPAGAELRRGAWRAIGTAFAPPPRSPVGFSAEMERVSELRSSDNPDRNPLEPAAVDGACAESIPDATTSAAPARTISLKNG